MTLRLAVLASGSGSNLQALIDRFNHHDQQNIARVTLVLSDRAQAGALARAREAAINAVHIRHDNRSSDDVGRELLAILEHAAIDLIILAGYLRLMPADVVRAYKHRVINIHPALLPAFGGKGMYGTRVHQAVLERGCSVTGVTVHYVDEEYDQGSVIAQWPVPVKAGDSAETLAARVLEVEHILFPIAVELIAHAFAHGEDSVVCARTVGSRFMSTGDSMPLETQLRHAFGVE